MPRGDGYRNNDGVTPKVLFLRNDSTATEAMLADVFTECGFDIDAFDVVAPDRDDEPAGDVTFPDPTDYDVIVPLGARWAVYDEALVNSWVGAEMAMVRRAVESGVGVLGVCFGGQLIAQALGGSVSRSPAPEVGWYDVALRRRGAGSGRPMVPVAFRPLDAAARGHRDRSHAWRVTGVRPGDRSGAAVSPRTGFGPAGGLVGPRPRRRRG